MIPILEDLAHTIADLARATGARVVLAESCTAGLAAHLLSRVPGASEWFCGSMVVYRNATKSAWLNVPAATLDDPALGPVSTAAASAMTAGVLSATPEATLAASVTGHLGPQAPRGLDGVVYIGVERRSPLRRRVAADVSRYQLSPALPADALLPTLRLHRQHEAALLLLRHVRDALQEASSQAVD